MSDDHRSLAIYHELTLAKLAAVQLGQCWSVDDTDQMNSWPVSGNYPGLSKTCTLMGVMTLCFGGHHLLESDSGGGILEHAHKKP